MAPLIELMRNVCLCRYNNSGAGIWVGKTVVNATILRNTIYHTRPGPVDGPAGFGITIEPHGSALVRENLLFDNAQPGIIVQQPANASTVVADNTFLPAVK